LDVEFISPHSSAYTRTPHQLVLSGEADIGIGPSESVISSFIERKDDSIIAVGAVAQEDDSAIVTLKSSGIDSMEKMDGKRYASYSARFEGRIIQRMIQHAGGTVGRIDLARRSLAFALPYRKVSAHSRSRSARPLVRQGEFIELSPEKLGVFETLTTGQADATWIFSHHEGLIAERAGVQLNYFKLADHGVVYGYPLVFFKSRSRNDNEGAVARFLHQLQKAYAWAVSDPAAAASNMAARVSELFPELAAVDADQLEQSVQSASATLLDKDGNALMMTDTRWSGFLDWLFNVGLMTTKMQSRGPASATKTTLDGLRGSDAGSPLPRDAVTSSDLFTNAFLN